MLIEVSYAEIMQWPSTPAVRARLLLLRTRTTRQHATAVIQHRNSHSYLGPTCEEPKEAKE